METARLLRNAETPSGWACCSADDDFETNEDAVLLFECPVWRLEKDVEFQVSSQTLLTQGEEDLPGGFAAFVVPCGVWEELLGAANESAANRLWDNSIDIGTGWKLLFSNLGDSANTDELASDAMVFFDEWSGQVVSAQRATKRQVLTLPTEATRPLFQRNGKPHLAGAARGYLIPDTPEERVRQDTIDWLKDAVGVPRKHIRSEVQARRGRARPVGRADIVAYLDPEQGLPLLVVECKAPNVSIGDEALEQGCRYAVALGAEYLVLTNRVELRAYRATGREYAPITALPRWSQMPAGATTTARRGRPFVRFPWDWISTPAEARRTFGADLEGVVGLGSPDYLIPLALDVFNLLTVTSVGPTLPLEAGAWQITHDQGRRDRTFGNASGGKWASEDYRSFVTRHRDTGEHAVVSLLVCPSQSTKNHPRYGNRKGYTYLNVAVDNDRQSHFALELRMDIAASESEFRRGEILLTHNGSLTLGKSGSAKRADVIGFVQNHAPSLVSGGQIVLGRLRTDRAQTWEAFGPVLANLIEYALVRDEFRAQSR